MQAFSTLPHTLDLRQFYAAKLSAVSLLDFRWTKSERRWAKVLAVVFFAEFAIAALLLMPSLQALVLPRPVLASAPTSLAIRPVELPPDTAKFIDDLRRANPTVQVIKSVARAEMSVLGVLTTVSDSTHATHSFQLFEYSDASVAHKEADAFTEKYAGRRLAPLVHVYLQSNLVAIYVGDVEDTLSTLDLAFNVPSTKTISANISTISQSTSGATKP